MPTETPTARRRRPVSMSFNEAVGSCPRKRQIVGQMMMEQFRLQ